MSELSDPDLRLCDFCRSIDWEQMIARRFDSGKEKRGRNDRKYGEHNLGSIRANSSTCELCELISDASRTLKPWRPIAEFLDLPEEITCAFFSNSNTLGPAPQARRIAQANSIVDSFRSTHKPGNSSADLIFQSFLNSLGHRRVLARSKTGPKRDNSLCRLLVLAGISPVNSISQTFLQLHPCLHPIPSVDEYAKGTNPFTTFPTGRIVRERVNIGLLRKWLERCIGSHGTNCSQPSWLAPGRVWPRNLRLIDVHRGCLVEAPDTEECTYFALSYVWGDETDPLRTTNGNIETLKRQGSLDSQTLPKTISDAMWLTKEMGVDYLWVDRLCVIQDSDADKAVQLPQMDLVYSCGSMTIVAASGTASDGLAGIHRTGRTIDQRTARVSEDLSVMSVLRLDRSYQDCAWRTRGWTVQEGLCSRRTLVVTRDQVYWSCETTKCCESIAFEEFPTTIRPGDIVFLVLSGHRIFEEFGGTNFSYSELNSMIQMYNKRRLTVEADILDAFSGVLNRVSLNTGHEFYWGHSTSTCFEQCLAWCNIRWHYDEAYDNQESPTRRRSKYRVRSSDGSFYEISFPSWSWLGWSQLLGVTRAAPRQVNLTPELNIMKLDLNGKTAPLKGQNQKTLESASEIDMCGIDSCTSAAWKGYTSISPSLLHRSGDFRDSGRLLFWTSHAVLNTSKGQIYGAGLTKAVVGKLSDFWPDQARKPSGHISFIVVCRKYNDHSDKVMRADRRLNVLGVEWVDRQQHIASRICSGEVDEEAWVKESREWVLVTLT